MASRDPKRDYLYYGTIVKLLQNNFGKLQKNSFDHANEQKRTSRVLLIKNLDFRVHLLTCITTDVDFTLPKKID